MPEKRHGVEQIIPKFRLRQFDSQGSESDECVHFASGVSSLKVANLRERNR